jgi:uncharacterized membrane protein YhaH (DUF805 family)
MNYFIRQLLVGRIGRLAYFFGTIYYFLSLLIPFLVISLIYESIIADIKHQHPSHALATDPLYALIILLYIALILADLSLSARRLNDVERPTWFCIFSVVPFVNIPLGLYLLLAPGTQGDNMYGAPLKTYGFWDVTKYKLLFSVKAKKTKSE